MDKRAIYMTIAECYLLLIQSDLQGLVIFEEIREYAADDREMAQSALSLAEKGILLVSEDGGYCLSEEVKGMLYILEKAKGTLVINGYLSSCPMQCFYFHGGACLILQMDDFREGFIRLEMAGWEDALMGLTDYEFMPDGPAGKGDGREERPDGKDFAGYSYEEDKERMLADRSVLLIADWFPKGTDCPDTRAAVIAREGRAFLAVSSQGRMNIEDYSTEVFLETVSGIFLEGGRHGFSGHICAGSRSEL